MGRRIVWSDDAWRDFEYWLDRDRGIVRKVRRLIKETQRDPFVGIGKPEPLRGDMSGLWSRRITDEHRFIYYVDDLELNIVSVRYHY